MSRRQYQVASAGPMPVHLSPMVEFPEVQDLGVLEYLLQYD